MPGATEYIESYFQQTLTSEERIAFEQKCETDKVFATEVAFYITAREALREELLLQKQQQWKEDTVAEEEVVPVISIAKKSTFSKWVAYAAAACLLLTASVYLFEAQTSSQKLAANYINKYDDLGTTMDASHDSMQLGIAAFKDKDYNRALQLFEGVEKADPSNSDAKRNAGLTYLKLNNYDEALKQFDELANMHLQSNAGDFLKAVTLLKRNNAGDKEAAKALLLKVRDGKEEGSEKAEEWLKEF